MDIRGLVITNLTQMVTLMKEVYHAVVLNSLMLLKIIGVCITNLVTLSVNSLKQRVLIAWNMKHYLVPQIIREDYKEVEIIFVNKRLGLLGRQLLTTVLLIPLAALKHLILGLYNVCKVLMVKLQNKG